MFFDERDKNLVSKRPRLTEAWVGAHHNILFDDSPIEFNFLITGCGAFSVMTEQRASDAQERVLHVELFNRLRCLSLCAVGVVLGCHKRATKL